MPTKNGEAYEQHYKDDPIIILKARALAAWIFRITSKKAKLPDEEFKTDSNNGMPVKYQHSLGTRMQNYSLDLLEQLQNARYNKKDRAKYITSALSTLTKIEECMFMCFTFGIIRSASAAEGERLRIEVKNMALAWKQNSMQG